ncbi:MAG: PSD1 and planctomycete cytochrome C domain-containing protein [Planctomycetaceae bacterium]
MRHSVPAACLCWGLLVSTAVAQPSDTIFERDVFPVLKRSCFECHGEQKQEGDLRLDRAEDIASTETVNRQDPASSELLRRIQLPADHAERMPAVGGRLSESDIEHLRSWILQGAVWPESFQERIHWAYVAPALPEVPSEFSDPWCRNEVDAFVLEQLRRRQLKPSAEAVPEVLIRRLFLDLIGLPPSPEEVNAFVADHSEDAYCRLVDDLLQRPQFGERWARHWLDLARYADSHGFQRDDLREIWAWRDWVIQAMNDDLPFDRFTIEQVAGDLLPDATEAQRIATGFHRCTPTNVEAGSLPEETRIEQVIDRVNTTGAVWLGTTLECCQCHDHKYDPFTSRDYYGLLAYFNNTEAEADRADPKQPSSIRFNGPTMMLSDPQRDSRRDELEQQIKTAAQSVKQHRREIEKTLGDWAAHTANEIQQTSASYPLKITGFESEGIQDQHQLLDDGSVLLTGTAPNTDVYTVTVRHTGPPIQGTGILLETLTHRSLPGKGPGRGDGKRSNFVLNLFTAAIRQRAATSPDDFTDVAFVSATADFSQQKWDVAGALNPKPGTGWAIAPEFGKPHWARFVLKESLELNSETELKFTLSQQFGNARNIGCFRLSAVTGNAAPAAIPADVAAAVGKKAELWTAKERSLLLDYRVAQDAEHQRLEKQLDQLKKQQEDLKPDETLVMIELPEARKSFVFQRGDYRNPGDAVTPSTPKILHSATDGRANRLGLAEWLVDERNPLVGRVTVNRWWAEIFGRGIVATVEDFGVKGDPPTHPELLDWLAVRFVQDGWSMKKVLKTIVLSATYRQTSTITETLLEADPQNVWLARAPRYRMDAEMIRDNLLTAAGLMDLTQFGPPIRPFQPDGIWTKVGGQNYDYQVSPGTEQYRRGIYVVLKRGAPYPSFVNFDATSRMSCTVKRSRTNTPLQALTLLNDPVYVEAAEAMAARILQQSALSSDEARLEYAFQLCIARPPTADERSILQDLLETERSVGQQRTASAKTVHDSRRRPADTTATEFRAWQAVTTTLINLHETITRP